MQPDYSKYTVDELYEALGSIDQHAYPQRTENIKSEIQQRAANTPVETRTPPVTKPKSKELGLGAQIFLSLMAVIFLSAAIYALYVGEINGARGADLSQKDQPTLFYLSFFTHLFVACYCVLQVYKQRKREQLAKKSQ
ncbi:hypothetical protein [Neptunicella marina]|uniref:Uncharacterized protein n=1 Tax=Neptunicella marina TaxID=2125989 RepID=A0A8J6J116_9ALTE|nr:hypothetical protein [Neptunicella marina]MBC3767698.1 hypothetical protein [Neptunicella marina]